MNHKMGEKIKIKTGNISEQRKIKDVEMNMKKKNIIRQNFYANKRWLKQNVCYYQ